MKITFDYLQDNTKQIAKATELPAAQAGKTVTQAAQSSSVSGILFGTGQDQQAYGKQGKSMQDIKDQAGLLTGDDYKNYMTIMAQSMSGEDFSALMEEGVKPSSTDPADAVTIMDHIKAVMAKSGVVVSGFNAAGDIPMEKLEAMTGSSAYAQSIANAFSENDVPLTEENVREAMKQTDFAMELTGLSDQVKQFLIENGSKLSIDQLYMASHSASARMGQPVATSGFSGNRTGADKGSYFADDLNGYYGKTPGSADYTMLTEQIEKVIKETGLAMNEQTKSEAEWLLDKGLLLTGENLEKLHLMNEMEFPVSKEDVLSHIAQALREGKPAKDADLSKDGIYKQAAVLKEAVDALSQEAVKQVVTNGDVLSIRNLSAAQRSIDLTMNLQTQAGNVTVAAAVSGQAAMTDTSLVHAQRTLEEVRLRMTVSANVMLLKSDYAIDTAELSDLVEQLKQMEQKMSQTQGLSLPDAQKHALFTDTMEKTTAIRRMPVAVIGRVLDISTSFTLSHVYEEGRILQSTYQKAGESYEALMTAPRADLGDRMKDAFSNIDDILQDLDFELNEDNRRSVRILAYNKKEITPENITAVRTADAELTFLLDKMTPSATLAMIRDGVNPLEQSVSGLTDYFMQKGDDPVSQAETFSRFLYGLEQSHEISDAERETYMGIYRLIRQIEKGDGKAIGTVVANGQELTFANLLSAVRTGQKRGIDRTIDDDFGLLTDAQPKGSRISDQINRYYETKASGLLAKMDPFVMAQGNVTMDTTWDELMELSETGESPQQIKASYEQEQLYLLREQLRTDGKAAEYLLANHQTVTPDRMEAAEKLTKNRGEMFRKTKELLTDEKTLLADAETADEEIMNALSSLTEDFTDAEAAQQAYGSVQDMIKERLEEEMLSKDIGILDLRAISSVAKQLSLAGNLAKEENYELPAVIDGELTSVNVHFRHEEQPTENSGSVSIRVELPSGEKLLAELKLQGDVISGYMGSSSREKVMQLESKKEQFIENILSETGKNADINFVHSEEIRYTYYENSHQAGKLVRSKVKDLDETNGRSEEVQGRHTSAKELYQTAKALIALLEEKA